MTAEIVIMNRNAIALAADSAVTLGRSEKTKQTANKIFALSEFEPVAIMVHGNATFMHIPWETIIKSYRKHIGKKSFSTIKEYTDDFIKYLKKYKDIVPEDSQLECLRNNFRSFFLYIQDKFYKEVEMILQKKSLNDADTPEISSDEAQQLLASIIDLHYSDLQDSSYLPGMTKKKRKVLGEELDEYIDEDIMEIFEKTPIPSEYRKMLKELALGLFTRGFLIEKQMVTGLVISGFGRDQIFPSMEHFYVNCLYKGYLRYGNRKYREITFKEGSMIFSFAQTDMVHAFMEGIDPELDNEILAAISEIIEGYPKVILDEIDSLNKDKRKKIEEKLSKIAPTVINDYEERMVQYRETKFVSGILEIVGLMPKTELGSMAEALISLTSLKREVSKQPETVSGPVDVAIISRGDGLVWMKRKHYFPAELNPHFIARYYRSGDTK